uniref:Peroxidase n=1 Tax=Gongylonema pulchrum TaxID=637853 RepID=A0A183E4T1_9BILA
LKVVAMTGIDFSAPPGHFALKSVLQELFTVFDRRIHNLKDIDVRNFADNHNSVGNDEQNEAKGWEAT